MKASFFTNLTSYFSNLVKQLNGVGIVVVHKVDEAARVIAKLRHQVAQRRIPLLDAARLEPIGIVLGQLVEMGRFLYQMRGAD